MQLGGSLGNVPQKMKKKYIFWTVSPFSKVSFHILLLKMD
jgi:hypothetical protein